VAKPNAIVTEMSVDAGKTWVSVRGDLTAASSAVAIIGDVMMQVRHTPTISFKLFSFNSPRRFGFR